MKILNQKIAAFVSGLTMGNYDFKYSFYTLQEAATSINLGSGDSGWYVPKAIEIKGVDGIFFLRESGQLHPDFKVIQKDGKFEVYEMNMKTYNQFEQSLRN